ncbi:MAG: pyridoxamine kinase [Treponema sp.]|nr:pyridoxamine kinase [Treponema sp.]
MKRIITIQDISCVGKCSLTVALPIISAMGVEACVLPTAVLSTHTAFKGFTFRDLTQDIKPICDHWKNEKIHFDAIYTGYLGSFEQLDLMKQLIDDFGGKDTITIVDPCMADNGKLYPGFTQEFAFAMAKLCSKANVIVPNLTEASFMLGVPYVESGYDQAYVEDMLKKLAALGAKKVVLKGIEFSENQKTIKGVKGKIGIAAYDAEQNRFSWYFHKKMPVSFHGTGDIFASVLTGALMKGFTLEKAYSLAADYVVESIKATLSHKDYNWYGVDFEAAMPYLVKRCF